MTPNFILKLDKTLKRYNLKLISLNEEKEYCFVLREIPCFVKKDRKANPFFPQTKYDPIAPGRLLVLLIGKKKNLTSLPTELYLHINDLEKNHWSFNDE